MAIYFLFCCLNLLDLLWKSSARFGVDNVVLIVVDLNLVFDLTYCHISLWEETLIDVYQVALLICRENDFVLMIELSSVLDDVSDMLCSLHVVFAPVVVDADVTYLLVLTEVVVSHSLFIIILVVVIHIWVLIVLELLGQLKDDLLFLLIVVVGVDQHVLVVIGHVEVLFELLEVVIVNLQLHLLLLDCELSIQMLQERHVGSIAISFCSMQFGFMLVF